MALFPCLGGSGGTPSTIELVAYATNSAAIIIDAKLLNLYTKIKLKTASSLYPAFNNCASTCKMYKEQSFTQISPDLTTSERQISSLGVSTMLVIQTSGTQQVCVELS